VNQLKTGYSTGFEPVTLDRCDRGEGFEKGNYVCELRRALYGLRESPSLWYHTFVTVLEEMGFCHVAISRGAECQKTLHVSEKLRAHTHTDNNFEQQSKSQNTNHFTSIPHFPSVCKATNPR